MSWFTDLEGLVYSVVEYIPGYGTIYSLKRANIAYREHDWLSHWQSVANALESSVRDIVLFSGTEEFATVAILHTMAESFTDKIIELYHNEPKQPKLKVGTRLDKGEKYVLVAKGKSASEIFEGKIKGVHYFHRAIFIGTLKDSRYAANGEKVRLDIRRGLYDGAKVTFAWKWTVDANGNKNRPEMTRGIIQLVAGTPTEFRLSERKGIDGWAGYDFWGKIMSEDKIIAHTRVDGWLTEIDFRRVPRT